MKVVRLYRPVGPKELSLIANSGWRRFPPRLPGQGIFYPVVQEEYAVRIARDWNAKSCGSGFVTRFTVDAEYLGQFETHPAGGSQFTEYWIPSDRLEEFNDHIRERIEVIAEFHSEGVGCDG